MKCTHLSRREFLKSTGVSATGFILGYSWLNADLPGKPSFCPNAFLVINRESGVTLHIPVAEVGQNIRTAIAMVLSDELGADLDSVRLKQAPPRNDMGHQTAAASQGVSMSWDTVRHAAASAREMLIQGAASKWNVSAASCYTDNSLIHGPGELSMTFVEAIPLANRQAVPAKPVLKQDSAYKYIGRDRGAIDARELSMGKTRFGMDAMPDGVRFAVVVRCPVYQGTLKSWDGSASKSMPGVVDVLQIGDKIAVTAIHTWAAISASRLVKAEWDEGKHAGASTSMLIKEQINGIRNPQQTGWKRGGFEEAYANAPIKLEKEFSAPALTHAPMEPPNCTAWYHDGGVEIWGSCQSLNRLYDALPEYAGLPHEKITYHQLRIGGGFGRKLAHDYIEEALQIARQVSYPVKLMFTREDDMRHDFYRAPDRYLYRVGMRDNGFPTALEEVSARRNRLQEPSDIALYFPNVVRKCTYVEPPFATGPMRGPRQNVSCFTEQSMIDCMAQRTGIDPMEYRLAIYGDQPAMAKLGWDVPAMEDAVMADLLRTVRERSRWCGDPAYGYGVAAFQKRNTRIAIVALAPKSRGGRPIEKVFLAVNPGRIVNPLGARAQMEGGIVDGIAAALYQKIEVRNGGVVQGNLHEYRLLEMQETPDIDIVLKPSREPPDGLGEMAYPTMMAAAANAISAATGTRITDLPIRK